MTQFQLPFRKFLLIAFVMPGNEEKIGLALIVRLENGETVVVDARGQTRRIVVATT